MIFKNVMKSIHSLSSIALFQAPLLSAFPVLSASCYNSYFTPTCCSISIHLLGGQVFHCRDKATKILRFYLLGFVIVPIKSGLTSFSFYLVTNEKIFTHDDLLFTTRKVTNLFLPGMFDFLYVFHFLVGTDKYEILMTKPSFVNFIFV